MVGHMTLLNTGVGVVGAVRFEQQSDGMHVVEAPEWADFSAQWLSAAVEARQVTWVGRDVVVHAVNGDFHYRAILDQPDSGAIRMKRVP
jgi:hypothetical protein